MNIVLSFVAQVAIFIVAVFSFLPRPLATFAQQRNADNLYPINQNGLWGYSDRNGNVFIKPQFAMGGFFDHGTAEVWRKDNGQKHLIDTAGNVIPDRNFESDHFAEGLIPVKIENKYGFADQQGRMIIFPQFEYASDFSEGLAAVEVGDKWGYINPAGAFVIKPQFDNAEDFSEGLAVIRVYGELLPKEKALQSFTDYDEAHDHGFINKSGIVQIAPTYNFAGDFSHGLAPVCNGVLKNKKCGYIDTTGKVVIEFKFDRASSFSEGLASVKIGSKFGYIDTTGTIVIPPTFETALEFQGGLAYASIGKTTYGWGRRGITVITSKFHGRQGYIDKTGRFVSEKLSWHS